MIAIIGAMQAELDFLLTHLNNKSEKHFLNQNFITGELNGVPVVLAKSGIGKVNASLMTALIIARFAPHLVINTGVAGGLASYLKQGDVVVASETAHHDVDVTVFGYAHGQIPQQESRFKTSASLLTLIFEADLNQQVHTGLILSGDQFIHSENQRATIKQHFPDVVAVEMESTAIMQTCNTLQTPCLIIRSISDLANQEAPLSFEEFLPIASQQSAEIVMNLIETINRLQFGK